MQRVLPLALAALLLAVSAPAASQAPPVFRHAGGNEWWVEVVVDPKPVAVDAMDTNGPWVALSFKSWGEWAASFHIEPGHDVKFRARWSDGSTMESCWFSHPAGVSRCDAGPTPPPPIPAGSRRVVVMGDTGAGPRASGNANASAAAGATAFIGLGDYAYEGETVAQWETALAPILALEDHLTIGNHDSASAMASHFPNGTTWSVSVNGARVVGIDTQQSMAAGSAQRAFVRGALCGAPEPLRILAMHKPWWLGSGAHHPGSEFPGSPADMDALVVECGVDVVLAAHEHNYQRLQRNGATYLIVGTGGRSLYAVEGAPSGTAFSTSTYGHLLLDVNASGYRGHVRTLDGRTLDPFAGGAGGGSSSVTFRHGGGNEWWVEAVVTPKPSSVDAMDEGGAWVPLAFKSWGEWAASFHIEPGNDVRFRATYPNGTRVESCWFTHPAGVMQCGSAPPPPPPSSFDATFSRVRGNEWWVETDVSVTGGTLAGVDARVNGGSWIALAKQDWGSWAKSIRAPSGSTVEFRARSTDGATDLSSAYRWPPA